MSVPALAALKGRLRVDLGSSPIYMLEIHDESVTVTRDDGEADAVAIFDSEESVAAFRCGELNPMVAILRGQLSLAGNLAFAMKVIRGLRSLRPRRAG